jgi:hypothetical protein
MPTSLISSQRGIYMLFPEIGMLFPQFIECLETVILCTCSFIL